MIPEDIVAERRRGEGGKREEGRKGEKRKEGKGGGSSERVGRDLWGKGFGVFSGVKEVGWECFFFFLSSCFSSFPCLFVFLECVRLGGGRGEGVHGPVGVTESRPRLAWGKARAEAEARGRRRAGAEGTKQSSSSTPFPSLSRPFRLSRLFAASGGPVTTSRLERASARLVEGSAPLRSRKLGEKWA